MDFIVLAPTTARSAYKIACNFVPYTNVKTAIKISADEQKIELVPRERAPVFPTQQEASDYYKKAREIERKYAVNKAKSFEIGDEYFLPFSEFSKCAYELYGMSSNSSAIKLGTADIIKNVAITRNNLLKSQSKELSFSKETLVAFLNATLPNLEYYSRKGLDVSELTFEPDESEVSIRRRYPDALRTSTGAWFDVRFVSHSRTRADDFQVQDTAKIKKILPQLELHHLQYIARHAIDLMALDRQLDNIPIGVMGKGKCPPEFFEPPWMFVGNFKEPIGTNQTTSKILSQTQAYYVRVEEGFLKSLRYDGEALVTKSFAQARMFNSEIEAHDFTKGLKEAYVVIGFELKPISLSAQSSVEKKHQLAGFCAQFEKARLQEEINRHIIKTHGAGALADDSASTAASGASDEAPPNGENLPGEKKAKVRAPKASGGRL